jgi:hypothetical protein
MHSQHKAWKIFCSNPGRCNMWSVNGSFSWKDSPMWGNVFKYKNKRSRPWHDLCILWTIVYTFSILKFQILPKSKTLRRAFLGENEGLHHIRTWEHHKRYSHQAFRVSNTYSFFKAMGLGVPTLHMHACNELWPQVHEFVTFTATLEIFLCYFTP